jgi:lipopolysaccharide/colanic/teichoic acid biosynthesis glycosyltransferase
MLYKNFIKLVFDKLFAIILILVLLPLFLFICLFTKIFIQKRVGHYKKIFNIYKFKTMNDQNDQNGKLLDDDQRLTKTGAFLRRYSLDEIPQVFNVLLGDMSFVGPRPLLTNYMNRYSEFQDQRHLVKPGITGWVQVNGRNSLTWDKRFELDVYYVQNQSFLLDFKILLRTIFSIFKKKGSFTENNISIEPFEN